MKIRRCIIILNLAVILALTGCANNDSKEKEISDVDISGKAIGSNYFSTNCEIQEESNGYYRYKSVMSNGMSGNSIIYVDEHSGASTFVCAKPDCSHVENGNKALASCDAFVGVIMPGSLVYSGKKLYYITYNSATFVATLCSMNKDGSNHESLYELGTSPSNSSCFKYIVKDGFAYYTYDHDPDNVDKKLVELIQLNLSTGEKKVIYGINQKGDINKLRYFGNCIYFMEYKTETSIEDTQSMCCRVNIENGEMEILAKTGGYGYTINGYRKELYYWKPEDGLYCLNLVNKEEKLLFKCTDKSRYIEVACDGKYIYLDNKMDYYFKFCDRRMMQVLDFSGNIISEIDMDSIMRPMYISDNRIYTMTLTQNVGETIIYINKADLGNSSLKWTTVE